MNAKEAAERLPLPHRKKLADLKAIRQLMEDEKVIKEYKDMIRGYLCCLLACGIIRQCDFGKLYIYYTL